MKTIIKILVAVVAITACFNAARAAMNNYQFEDAVHQGLLFDGRANDAEIVEMVTKLAVGFDIAIDPANIKIRQVGQDINVEMSYTRSVMLVPGFFQRDWTFTPSASTKMLIGNRRQ